MNQENNKRSITISNCRECKSLTTGFNGEYRCRSITNTDGYYGDDYFGDRPPETIPDFCPKLS